MVNSFAKSGPVISLFRRPSRSYNFKQHNNRRSAIAVINWAGARLGPVKVYRNVRKDNMESLGTCAKKRIGTFTRFERQDNNGKLGNVREETYRNTRFERQDNNGKLGTCGLKGEIIMPRPIVIIDSYRQYTNYSRPQYLADFIKLCSMHNCRTLIIEITINVDIY